MLEPGNVFLLNKRGFDLLFDSFYYKEKGVLQTLHPGAAVALILVFSCRSWYFPTPLYLAGRLWGVIFPDNLGGGG